MLIGCLKNTAGAQCTTMGQTPASAFPVCGTGTFVQTTVPLCSNGIIMASTCGPYDAMNPFFYKFTCYKAGSLDFVITPNNLVNDDYDWQLFDITTAHYADEIYTNAGLYVAANWSGSYGRTGARPGHPFSLVCGSLPGATDPFSYPPLLKQGHDYILLISHFSSTQSGYSLTFGGGTAVITDPAVPGLKNAEINCDGTKIGLKITRKVSCNSLAPDGSDFALSIPGINVIGATGYNCNSQFDMDSVTLSLDKPLPPGSYEVFAKNGSDGNTLLNSCGIPLPAGDSVALTVYPPVPTPMDSIAPGPQCSAQSLTLVFRKNIECNSIAPDGSDFVITGPQAVTIKNAGNGCPDNGISHTVTVNFTAPIIAGGNYTIKLKKGSDGNTILDECGQETPAGQSLTFHADTSVLPSFTGLINWGCTRDTLTVSHDGNGNANYWHWIFSDGAQYFTQSVTRIYKDYGRKGATLIVSNGLCTDSLYQPFMLDNRINAGITSPSGICPEDKAIFADSSYGKVVAWQWDFGNGATSALQNPPPQTYQQPLNGDKYYITSLIVQDSMGCRDTAYKGITVRYTCYIAVASAFTPNGDGLNDYLYPLNAYKTTNLEFKVFNRWGQQVFATKDWTNKWDGTFKGTPQPPGTYIWMLNYTDTETSKQHFLRGTSVLIR